MNNNTKLVSSKSQNSGNNSGNNRDKKGPGDFLVGLVTFIVFIVFMTVWMYFSV